MSEHLIGSSWHESPQKHLFDARMLQVFARPALILTGMAAMTLAFENKWPFEQERIGYDGKPFMLPKLQTLESQNVPYGHTSVMTSASRLIRYLALDELIGLAKVSGDPDNPGALSIIGRRPLMRTTLKHMRAVVPEHFDAWFENVYCRMRPGVFGVFGTLQAKRYPPLSPEYYTASMLSDYWYFQNGSEAVDQKVLHHTLLVGYMRLHGYNSIKEFANSGEPDVILTLAKPELEAHNHN